MINNFSNPNKAGTWSDRVQNVGTRFGEGGMYKFDGTGLDLSNKTKKKIINEKNKDDIDYHSSIYNSFSQTADEIVAKYFSGYNKKEKLINVVRDGKNTLHRGLNKGLGLVNKTVSSVNDGIESFVTQKAIANRNKKRNVLDINGKEFVYEKGIPTYIENGVKYMIATKNREKASLLFNKRIDFLQKAKMYLKKEKGLISNATDLTIYSNKVVAAFKKLDDSIFIYMDEKSNFQGLRNADD